MDGPQTLRVPETDLNPQVATRPSYLGLENTLSIKSL